MKRRLFLTLFFVLIAVFLMKPSMAESEPEDTLDPNRYVESIWNELPDDAQQLLPEGEDPIDQIKNADSTYLLSLSGSFFKTSFSSFFKYLLFFVAATLLAALGNAVEETFESNGKLIGKMAILAMAATLFSVLLSLSQDVLTFAEHTRTYMSVTAGVLSTVSFLGASPAEGTLTLTFISITLVLTVDLVVKWLLPVLRISYATTLASSVSEGTDLRRFSSFARRAFLFLLGIVSTVSTIVLTFQHTVAQAEDSVAARALRFTASHTVPLVGNTVSDAVRTLASGVTLIRTSSGAAGILGVLLLSLYPFSTLLSAKLALALSGAVAGILGAKPCEELFDDVSKMIDMMMATVAILVVLNIFLLSVFSKGMTALSA